jgi:predicted nuclease of predicted toxin-antitoxin system
VKLLLDANLSPTTAQLLGEAEIESEHVFAVGMANASDEEILAYAKARELVVVTADSDFPRLVALERASGPSVIHLRAVDQLRPPAMAALLLDNLPAIEQVLAAGALVSLSPVAIRVRRLPLEADEASPPTRTE